MDYPGRIIKMGEADAAIVKALKRQLNKALVLSRQPSLRLDPENARFGPTTKQAVMLFQSQHVDASSVPLKVDGYDPLYARSQHGNFTGLRVTADALEEPDLAALAIRIEALSSPR